MRSTMHPWGLADYIVLAVYILALIYTSSSEILAGHVSLGMAAVLLLVANCYVLAHFIKKYW